MFEPSSHLASDLMSFPAVRNFLALVLDHRTPEPTLIQMLAQPDAVPWITLFRQMEQLDPVERNQLVTKPAIASGSGQSASQGVAEAGPSTPAPTSTPLQNESTESQAVHASSARSNEHGGSSPPNVAASSSMPHLPVDHGGKEFVQPKPEEDTLSKDEATSAREKKRQGPPSSSTPAKPLETDPSEAGSSRSTQTTVPAAPPWDGETGPSGRQESLGPQSQDTAGGSIPVGPGASCATLDKGKGKARAETPT